jgi:hypothetical protein
VSGLAIASETLGKLTISRVLSVPYQHGCDQWCEVDWRSPEDSKSRLYACFTGAVNDFSDVQSRLTYHTVLTGDLGLLPTHTYICAEVHCTRGSYGITTVSTAVLITLPRISSGFHSSIWSNLFLAYDFPAMQRSRHLTLFYRRTLIPRSRNHAWQLKPKLVVSWRPRRNQRSLHDGVTNCH